MEYQVRQYTVKDFDYRSFNAMQDSINQWAQEGWMVSNVTEIHFPYQNGSAASSVYTVFFVGQPGTPAGIAHAVPVQEVNNDYR